MGARLTANSRDVASVDIVSTNADIDPAVPTADVAIYYPANLDAPHTAKVTLDLLIEGFLQAKRIFGEAGVQLRLAWVRSGFVDPALFAIQSTASEDDSPGQRFVNMYRAAERRPSRLSLEAEQAFESIVGAVPNGDRIVHLVTLQDVYMTFYEQLDFRTWQQKTITTGGLSFPAYMYGSTIPRHLRGVITITDLTKDEDSWKTIAHELGHKLMNVSHEYRDTSPQHEVKADGGLMLYGSGTEIPSGPEGRFHRERLHRSPYVYRIDESGERDYNPDYAGGGFYYDEIYKDISVEIEASVE